MTGPSEYSLDGIEARLKVHTGVFNRLLETIPPKFYIAEVNEKLSANDYQKRKKSKVEAKKAKKAKLNPANQLSVLELQEAQRLEEEANEKQKGASSGVAKQQQRSMNGHAHADDRDDASEDGEDVEMVSVFSVGSRNGDDSDAWESDVPSAAETSTAKTATGKAAKRKRKVAASQVEFTSPAPFCSAGEPILADSPAGTIDTLRDRLKARISALREKRHAEEEDDDDKRASVKERKEEKRRSREERKLKKKELEKKSNDKQGGGGAPESIFGDSKADAEAPTDGINIDGDVNYMRFQFEGEKKRHLARPEHALQKLEKEKEKLQTLKETDAEKANQLEEQSRWQRAVKLARGDKLRDDEQMLRKTLKRTADKKKRSEKAWKERTDTVRTQQEHRQKKRTDNLQARIDGKKNHGKKSPGKKGVVKKTGKTVKSGKSRAGFEGVKKKPRTSTKQK